MKQRLRRRSGCISRLGRTSVLARLAVRLVESKSAVEYPVFDLETASHRLGLSVVQYRHMATIAENAFRNQLGEMVALVWSSGSGEGGFSWLKNVAPWPEVRFSVDGHELRRAISSLVSSCGDSVRIVALWHSHQRSVEPSSVDVREFPSWLTDLGAIYVVSGGGTVFYSGENYSDRNIQEQMEGEAIE